MNKGFKTISPKHLNIIFLTLFIFTFYIIGISSTKAISSTADSDITSEQTGLYEVSKLVFIDKNNIKNLGNNIYSYEKDTYHPEDILPYQKLFGVKTSYVKYFETIDCTNKKVQTMRLIAYKKSNNKPYTDIDFWENTLTDVPPPNTVGYDIYKYICNVK